MESRRDDLRKGIRKKGGADSRKECVEIKRQGPAFFNSAVLGDE